MGKRGKNIRLWSISIEYERHCTFYETEREGRSSSPPNLAHHEPSDEIQLPKKSRRRQMPQRPVPGAGADAD